MATYKQQNVELMERLTAAVGKMIEQEQDITNLSFEVVSLKEKLDMERTASLKVQESDYALRKDLKEMQDSNELSARVIRKLLDSMDQMEKDLA
jgi:FtsZ-binding cell division protein ZapB